MKKNLILFAITALALSIGLLENSWAAEDCCSRSLTLWEQILRMFGYQPF